MSSKSTMDSKKNVKCHSVTSRCVAVVLKRVDSSDNKPNDSFENEHVESQTQHDDNANNPFSLNANFNSDNSEPFDAKKVFSEFKLRNKTCYWNPALVDSVNSLEYVGFIEPLTILVKGDDIHLENIRTAWGRRVLKDPANYRIERIGDVNGIEMQVIPQTQFIPLPEALCLIIMDLNNNQIVATLDTVCERLKHCYQGLHLPSNQLVYDTLGQLIRERKVFHTGCGYFVVTPDTFRIHGNTDIQTSSILSPWTHLHPMYIPAAFGQPPRQPMRSISCQVDSGGNMIGHFESCDQDEKDLKCDEKLQVDLPSPRLQRSMSVSGRRPRDRSRKDEISDRGSVRRSSSVKGRSEKSKSVSKEDAKLEGKQAKTKEKVSIFSKIFGRNKKKQTVPEPKKTDVEYSTFSAQFPPPEWMWYQQQMDRQIRTETWVQQQMVKSGTWHYLSSMPTDGAASSLNMGATSAPERPSALQNSQSYGNSFGNGITRKSHKKSHKHKERLPIVIANTPGESTHLDIDKKHTYKNSMGHTNIRLSSLPTRVSPSSDLLQSNYVSHPMFSSTPRFSSASDRRKTIEEETPQVESHSKDKPIKLEKEKSRSSRRSHRSKKKTHHDRHSSYLPMSRHVSGISANTAAQMDNDISYQYQGQLANKNTAVGRSHSSGVNCVGLEPEPEPVKQKKNLRSNSYRVTVSDSHRDSPEGLSRSQQYQRSYSYRHPVSDHESNSRSDVNGHIYANVHVNEETKPKVPERMPKNFQTQSRRCEPPRESAFLSPASSSTHYRVHLPEADRHSEHGSDVGQSEHTSSSGGGTLKSISSQEPGSQDSAVEGTVSSEQSLSTVIDRAIVNKHMERLTADVKEMSLGDSGFSSPRVSEISSESKNGGTNFKKEQNGFMCNNLKGGQRLNNSNGKLDVESDDSFDRISSDRLYENVRLSQKEVLNNMKYLHKEITVSSQNLNVPVTSSDTPSSSGIVEFDPKQSVAKKFNFEGDFHVVGVV
ncbi:Storkhead box 1 [Mactra antiquata]